MPYITPRQMATESSTTPKSVMNTIVGGYFWPDSVAARDGAGAAIRRKNTAARTIARRGERFRLLCGEIMEP
jgi:hypothetical protein